MHLQSNFIPTEYDKFINRITTMGIREYFPPNMQSESRFSRFGVDNPDKFWFRYMLSNSVRDVINENELAGNAQRGQITELPVEDLEPKEKKYWDWALINAIQNGEMMDGPFYGIIKGLLQPLQNDWLHRTQLKRQFARGVWTFTNESPYPNRPLDFKGKNINSIIMEMGQDWINEKFFNRKLDSTVYVYYSDDLDVNLRHASEHFGLKNQNTTDIQKIHALHSETNTELKMRSGMRLLKFTQNSKGKVDVSEEITHKNIRQQTPFGVFNEKKIDGYDDEGKRLYGSGYRYPEKDWIALKPYAIMTRMAFAFSNVTTNNNYYPNLSSLEGGLKYEFVANRFDNQPTINWSKFDKNIGNFSSFWHRCQDYLKYGLKYNIGKNPGRLDLFNHKTLSNTYVIWNAFNQVGNYINHDGDFYKVFVEMLRYWNQREPYIVKGDSKNYYGHARGNNYEKQFFNLMELLGVVKHECKYEDNDLKQPVTFRFDAKKENYLDWGFRFTDIDVRKFKPKFRRLVSTKYNGCFITGKNTIELAAHHNIYHKNGGKTNDIDNCVMIDETINKNLNAFSKTSEGVKEFLKNDVILPERKPHWEMEGGLQKLIDFENDVENYYWPDFTRYQVEIHKNKTK